MAGQYKKLRNELQQYADAAPRSVEIRRMVQELHNSSRRDVALALKDLKNRKAALKSELSTVDALIEAHTLCLVENLLSSNEESFKPDFGGTFFLQDKVYPSVKDPEAFRRWCMNNGFESKLVMHPKTLESLCGNYALEGLPYPDGVEVFLKTVIGTRGVLEKSNGEEE